MANFIKKNWQKDAGNVAINEGLRVGGALGTAFILNKWFSGEPRDGQDKQKAANTAKTLHNISGPLFLGIGVLGDMMAEDDRMKSLFQGMATVAALQSIAVIAPSVATNDGTFALGSIKGVQGVRGLRGIDADAKLLSGVNALNGRGGIDRPALGATSMSYTGSNPEELSWATGGTQVDTDGKTYNNDWGYLAKNIDVADQITKSVNGVDDEAAALMGVASAEEAALLMGMF